MTAGTIMAENEPYRGLGVVVCSQAVLPPNDGPRLLYSVGLQGPTREMLLGCFEHGGHYLDPSTGQPGDELPEEAYLAMTRAISGTGAGDGAVFEEVYTAKAVAEMTQGLPV